MYPSIPTTPATPAPCSSALEVEIELSVHCIARFGERVHPCFDAPRLEVELERLLVYEARIVYVRPAWIAAPPDDSAVAWAVIHSDIALPLVPHEREHGVLVAVTCLTAGGISHAERHRRRIRKARQRRGSRR